VSGDEGSLGSADHRLKAFTAFDGLAEWYCTCGSRGYATKPGYLDQEDLEDTMKRALKNFNNHQKRHQTP
jgi:hypothetical protein